MRLKNLLFLSAILGLSIALTGCGGGGGGDKKEELAKFAGKWKIKREGDVNEEDEDDGEDRVGESYYAIDGDIMRGYYVNKKGTEFTFSRFKISLSGDKNVDLTYLDENNKPLKERKTKKTIGKKARTTTTDMKDLGIYKIDGDTITMCLTFGDKRPTDFKLTAKSSTYLLTLTKVKDPSKEEPKGTGSTTTTATTGTSATPATPATGGTKTGTAGTGTGKTGT